MGGAPIEVIGWDDDREVLLARREGDPSFVWAQDFEDAYYAALMCDVDLVIPQTVWDDLYPGRTPPDLSNLRILPAGSWAAV